MIEAVVLILALASPFGGCMASIWDDDNTDASVMVQPLKLAKQYHLKGILHLPYAELEEPIEAWYDRDTLRSRIDYYNGIQKVYQYGLEGEYGTQSEVIPVSKSRENSNVKTCISFKGSAHYIARGQQLIPDEEGFKMVGKEVCMGELCEKWQLVEDNVTKVNTYTLYVKRRNGKTIPMKYQMSGYNGLLQAHYDHYNLIYTSFEETPIDSSVFEIDPKLKCPGKKEEVDRKTLHARNPFREIINRDDMHVNDAFEDFKTTHNKDYKDEKEHLTKYNNFLQNLRYINSKNREGLSYSLAVNHLADLSSHEMSETRYMRSKKCSAAAPTEDTGTFTYTAEDAESLPENWDWRIPGAVTQVKDQATCGSCWSFGAVGAVEGAYFVKYGQRLVFSEQALVDCTWGEGSSGCDGGCDMTGYNLMMKAGGLPTEEEYGRYLGVDGFCHIWNATKAAVVKGFKVVKSEDEEAVMVALYKKGPLSISIDANPLSMRFYASGVYSDPTCRTRDWETNHTVLLVGYGTLNGKKYWVVKNSWSTHWGNDGYIIISREPNDCGVASSANFPVLQ